MLLVNKDVPMRLDDTCLVKLEGLDTLVDLATVTVGIPVTVEVDTVVEPLIFNDEFPCSDDELATRVLTNSGETSLLSLSICELTLVFKVLLVSKEVIEVCDIEGEVTKLELNSAELRAKLRVTLGVINVPLLLDIVVVSRVAADVAFNKAAVVINNTDEDLVLDKTT